MRFIGDLAVYTTVLPFLAYQILMSFAPYIFPTLHALYYYVDLFPEMYYNDRSKHSSGNISQEKFDFIVVGGGATGSVIAYRLSKTYSVLLLEAGGDPIPLLAIPSLFGILLVGNQHSAYHYHTVSQTESCLALKNQESNWPFGKCLGGSASYGTLVWLKGHDKDYDQWAKVTGDERWSSTNLLPFFKKVERVGTKDDYKLHEKIGKIYVEKVETKLGERFIEAAKELRLDKDEPDGAAAFNHPYLTRENGITSSPFLTYIKPVRNSPKYRLTIRKFSTVRKILFNGNTTDAIGVEYQRFGQIKTVYARKETIISAGVVESPKLLMLSGIGPKDHLEELNIQIRVDAPVGNNLQDHFFALQGPNKIKEPISSHPQLDINWSTLRKFFSNPSSGPITYTPYTAHGFITSSIAKRRNETSWPDLQIGLVELSMSDEFIANFMEQRVNAEEGILHKYFQWAYGRHQHSFFLVPVLVRPKSRGTLRLRGTDPLLQPLIDPRYLSHPDDVKSLIEGLQITAKMLQETTSFQSIGTEINPTLFPGCESHPQSSDSYWECFVRRVGLSGDHAAGTCSMGKVGSKEAVVDSELRVIGTKNLRVADASVMPNVAGSNTLWPCLMIGERVAQFIIDQNNKI